MHDESYHTDTYAVMEVPAPLVDYAQGQVFGLGYDVVLLGTGLFKRSIEFTLYDLRHWNCEKNTSPQRAPRTRFSANPTHHP